MVEILLITSHEMCLTEYHWMRGCTGETWKQPLCCHCWTLKQGQRSTLLKVFIGCATCPSIHFYSLLKLACLHFHIYTYPGVAQARVVVDENTDPASLNLSNCSVDGVKLGKCFLFLILAAHLFMHIFHLTPSVLSRKCTESFVPLINVFPAGLDTIWSEKDRERKASAKATQDTEKEKTQRKLPTDDDDDYKPKLTPGWHSSVQISCNCCGKCKA